MLFICQSLEAKYVGVILFKIAIVILVFYIIDFVSYDIKGKIFQLHSITELTLWMWMTTYQNNPGKLFFPWPGKNIHYWISLRNLTTFLPLKTIFIARNFSSYTTIYSITSLFPWDRRIMSCFIHQHV